MGRFILFGIAAGLASAFLLVSTAVGGLGARVIVYLLAPLPLILAGLGAGSLTAAIGAVTSALVLLAMVDPRIAALHVIGHGIPAVVLCHFAGLSRPVTPQSGPAPVVGIEWYPIGRIVATAAVCAGIYGFVSTALLGVDPDQQRQLMRRLMDAFAKSMPRKGGQELSEDDISQLIEWGVRSMPAAAAFSWLIGMLFNLYLGARITALSGRLQRPAPDVPSMTYPVGFSLGLAGALPLAFVSGLPGQIGSALAGAFFCAHVLMGLAIIHDVTRGVSARLGILIALYVALVVLNGWVMLGLAIFAAMAPILPLRRGNASTRSPPD